MSLPISGSGSGEPGKAGEGGVPADIDAPSGTTIGGCLDERQAVHDAIGVLLEQPTELRAVDFAALLDRKFAHGVQQLVVAGNANSTALRTVTALEPSSDAKPSAGRAGHRRRDPGGPE